MDEAGVSGRVTEIFHGPYDLVKTLEKYTLSYENEDDAEANDRFENAFHTLLLFAWDYKFVFHTSRKRQKKPLIGSSRCPRNLSSRPGVLGSLYPPASPTNVIPRGCSMHENEFCTNARSSFGASEGSESDMAKAIHLLAKQNFSLQRKMEQLRIEFLGHLQSTQREVLVLKRRLGSSAPINPTM